MHDQGMRTTIEIDDEVRARLLQRAAERGERGYSDLINEILKQYFGVEDRFARKESANRVERLAGRISEEAAERMYESVKRSRTNWQTES